MRFHFPRFLIASAVLLIATGSAGAVIMKLTQLADVFNDDYIFVASVDKLDPAKPSAIFKVEKKLKGEVPFDKLPVNMTGNAEAKKVGDTKKMFERLDDTRKVVFFVKERAGTFNAKAFVEGTWFSVQGTEDPADKVVRWAFQCGEPFLRRTFKGTTAEMVRVVEDGLANKAKPPAANEKEEAGYGPVVEKKEKKCDTSERGVGNPPATSQAALFGVIPSFALLGPMAIIAALFPGVFARMAVGMKRWRAFLVVASANSTLALIYWALLEYWPEALPGGWWGGVQAFTILLLVGTVVGLSWAGRRYRRMAIEEPAVTSAPSRTELYALAGLTAFAAFTVVLVTLFQDFKANFALPLREFTFIGIAVLVATLYATYRYLTPHVDAPLTTPTSPTQPLRLSLSGETVALGSLFLCGLLWTLSSATNANYAISTETGDAEPIGPRFVSVKTFEVKKSHQVMSGITVSGDRIYFGTVYKGGSDEGQVVCMNRETGEVAWRFGDKEQMKTVFCTPTVVGGKIYCGEGTHEDKACRLFCINADGKPGWDTPIDTTSHTEGAPALSGDKLFFPAGDEGLIAVNAKTKAELWRFKGGPDAGIHIDGAPTVSGNRVFVGSGLYTFVAVALDTDSGKELWRTDLKLRSFGAPFAAGKHVYYGIGTGNMGPDVFEYPEENGKNKEDKPAGAVVCLDIESGKEVWRRDLPKSVHTAIAGDAFSVYAACKDGSVHAFDRKTGKPRWRTGIGFGITAPPAVATSGGLPIAVYAVTQDGNLMCLNPHTGGVVWQKKLPGYTYNPQGQNEVLCGPTVVTTATPAGSTRAIYVGAMTVDPENYAKRTCAVFRFEDVLDGE